MKLMPHEVEYTLARHPMHPSMLKLMKPCMIGMFWQPQRISSTTGHIQPHIDLLLLSISFVFLPNPVVVFYYSFIYLVTALFTYYHPLCYSETSEERPLWGPDVWSLQTSWSHLRGFHYSPLHNSIKIMNFKIL